MEDPGSEDIEVLVKMIIPPERTILEAFLEVVFVTDLNEFISALLIIAERHHQCLQMVYQAIENEIDVKDTVSNIFRNNGGCTKMLSFFAQKRGVKFLKSALEENIVDIYKVPDSVSFEVDPSKLSDKEDAIDNTKRLAAAAQQFFDRIYDSEHQTPPSFRLLCHKIVQESRKKYVEQDDKGRVVGSFMFLRFFCPAIVSPHAFGLTKDPPTKQVQRGLILISKTLQALSNGVTFGHKENYMIKLNEFLDNNNDNLLRYFSYLSGINEHENSQFAEEEKVEPVTKKDYLQAISVLHYFMTEYLPQAEVVLLRPGEGKGEEDLTEAQADLEKLKRTLCSIKPYLPKYKGKGASKSTPNASPSTSVAWTTDSNHSNNTTTPTTSAAFLPTSPPRSRSVYQTARMSLQIPMRIANDILAFKDSAFDEWNKTEKKKGKNGENIPAKFGSVIGSGTTPPSGMNSPHSSGTVTPHNSTSPHSNTSPHNSTSPHSNTSPNSSGVTKTVTNSPTEKGKEKEEEKVDVEDDKREEKTKKDEVEVGSGIKGEVKQIEEVKDEVVKEGELKDIVVEQNSKSQETNVEQKPEVEIHTNDKDKHQTITNQNQDNNKEQGEKEKEDKKLNDTDINGSNTTNSVHPTTPASSSGVSTHGLVKRRKKTSKDKEKDKDKDNKDNKDGNSSVPESGEEYNLYCVFDGHGGKEASMKAKEIIQTTFHKHWMHQHSLIKDSTTPKDHPTLLLNLERNILHNTLCDMDLQMKEFQYLGCTATLLLISQSNSNPKLIKITVANLGDSECHLSIEPNDNKEGGNGGGNIIEMSREHKVGNGSERRRIESLGIYLESGATRIGGGIAISRALGDHYSKDNHSGMVGVPWVSEGKEVEGGGDGDEKGVVVVLASDGLWDVITGEKAPPGCLLSVPEFWECLIV
eukprot:TRINITY_DN1475_c1_g3_i1.p1 TRINITY_DN1475_c1_g3~~TRINITY_DN1475_c1_g3_i1.p1  ORF type:complete len:918 (-),score=249.22 TRINITY_DN1475_c1_g3_i1:88-2841(-)